ncbi:head-tail connector protein [Anatilimnocola floriformis]|uniref:head-tail connector protein n=1 Tax=Anatilimnocola floriformis TaxID=2948575 RepID=UPI0020C1CAA2|nr:head-tail connector protein [Anatilimnocola floriformis]
MFTKLITAPASYPITLSEAKAHLKVEHSDEDTLITSYLDAATQYVETLSGLHLVAQTWEQHQHGFYCNWLLKLPIQSITHIKYYDGDNVLQTLDSAEYRLQAPYKQRAWIEPVNSWPSTYCRSDAVQIRFVAGFSAVPERAKQAVRLALGVFHAERSGEIVGTISKQLENGINRLCNGLRGY